MRVVHAKDDEPLEHDGGDVTSWEVEQTQADALAQPVERYP